MGVLEGKEPEKVFRFFEEIAGIPHGSGNVKQISDYLVSFAKEHGLEYVPVSYTHLDVYKRQPGGCAVSGSCPCDHR